MAKDLVLEKLKEHDDKFDLLIKKVIDHDERFDNIDRKFEEVNNNMNSRLDEILVIVQRIDQERVFTFEYVKRIEGDVNKIKKILKIA